MMVNGPREALLTREATRETFRFLCRFRVVDTVVDTTHAQPAVPQFIHTRHASL